MKFTFGIITTDPHKLEHIIESITVSNCIPEFEIIIVGGDESYNNGIIKIIPFDESKKPAWITRKKNIITENAKYDNIVYLHDYIILNPEWYNGFLKFGQDFDICMTKMENLDGSRFRDWTLWPHDVDEILGSGHGQCLLPYDTTNLSKFMYISGSYWIAKKYIMQKFPLDESLSWGESEDVKWSKEVRNHHSFSINSNSSVKLLKQKDRVFNEIFPDSLKRVQEFAKKS